MFNKHIRLVPAGWNHPRDEQNKFKKLPTAAAHAKAIVEWDEANELWEKGLMVFKKGEEPKPIPKEWVGSKFPDVFGTRPAEDDCMPAFESPLLRNQLDDQKAKAAPSDGE